jgi:hypothetical protein
MTEKRQGQQMPTTFPDEFSCRVQREDYGDYFQCLSRWAPFCPFNFSLASLNYCSHPDSREILAGTFKNKTSTPPPPDKAK